MSSAMHYADLHYPDFALSGLSVIKTECAA
jgi:hypothetical protein